MEEKAREALWAMTELEAAAHQLLETLERAREAMRRTLEGGQNST